MNPHWIRIASPFYHKDMTLNSWCVIGVESPQDPIYLSSSNKAYLFYPFQDGHCCIKVIFVCWCFSQFWLLACWLLKTDKRASFLVPCTRCSRYNQTLWWYLNILAPGHQTDAPKNGELGSPNAYEGIKIENFLQFWTKAKVKKRNKNIYLKMSYWAMLEKINHQNIHINSP